MMARSSKQPCGLRCPGCGYDLRGRDDARCPECGKTWTPRDFVRAARRSTRTYRWLVAAIVLLPLFYLPYVWLFEKHGSLIDWTSLTTQYRGHWFRLYPVLPGMIPELITRRVYENETLVMSIYTALFVGSSLWIGSRSRKALIIIAILVGLYGVWAFFVTQAVYKA